MDGVLGDQHNVSRSRTDPRTVHLECTCATADNQARVGKDLRRRTVRGMEDKDQHQETPLYHLGTVVCRDFSSHGMRGWFVVSHRDQSTLTLICSIDSSSSQNGKSSALHDSPLAECISRM